MRVSERMCASRKERFIEVKIVAQRERERGTNTNTHKIEFLMPEHYHDSH